MRQSLSGVWQFRFDRDEHWQLNDVPGCWEMTGAPKDDPGPAWYRREVTIPREWQGRRIWLRFQGVSYACEVFVRPARRASPAANAASQQNSADLVGQHIGLWDSFRVEITPHAQPGQTLEVLVRVEKPASLTAGPDSPHVPGRFPQKQTLSGFLPYVWGHMFGGIWQDVWLEATGEILIEDLCIRGDHAGNIRGEARLSDDTEALLEVFDPDGRRVIERRGQGRELLFIEKVMPPRAWSPEAPALYEARLTVASGETRIQKFGMRSVRAAGPTLLLNEQPVYPRMILSWGWYEQSLFANPGREQVRRDLERLRSLGYNGVKLCLWVPPAYYFEIADELGMLVWLELPMWMPQVSEFFLRQTPMEYERIVRQVRHHPSIILYTLGCELDAKVGGDLLSPLFAQTKNLIGDALLRDNSGSGETYGGLLDEFAEFYDYHFYSELQFFRPLLDCFAPRWRNEQPFLFGEFCDADTWRDLRKLQESGGGKLPWWARDDDRENPQGARWQHDVGVIEKRLREHGLWDRQDELERISYRQALVRRKFTLELVRTFREVSGYVVTGERDTPISKAGMWTGIAEGAESLKFDPGPFAAFNSDGALSPGWGKRRAWVRGGDRAAHWDTFSYVSGQTVRAHLIASNYSRLGGPAVVQWEALVGNQRIGEGECGNGGDDQGMPLPPGEVREIGIAQFAAPEVDRPARGALRARLLLDGKPVNENEWPLWFFPRAPLGASASTGGEAVREGPGPAAAFTVRVIDPFGRFEAAEAQAGGPRYGLGPWLREDASAAVVLATMWTDQAQAHVQSGGRAILLQGAGAGPIATVGMPFWREAIKLIEPHPAWGDFPHDGFCDLQFFGMATDLALDTTSLAGAGASAAPRRGRGDKNRKHEVTAMRPILRRIDARSAAIHDYAVELEMGAGRVIVSTLRFEGGLGEQPLGLSRNTAAAYLLACWVRYLQSAPENVER